MKTLILANPNAGSLEDPSDLESAVESLPDTEVHFTEEVGEAERQARRSLEQDWDCVVAAGGDGTIHEVVNGLSEGFGKVKLGVVPLGTGNDLARSLGIPPNLEDAVEILRQGDTRVLDVIRVRFDDDSERLCLNMATGGFSGEMNDTLDTDTKRTWGPLSYLRSAVEAVPDLKSFRLDLEADGEEALSLPAYSVVVANGRWVACGIQAAPEADPCDGLLDVVVIPELKVGQIAMLAPQVLTGLHLSSDLIRFVRTRKVTIAADPGFSFNLDGEEHGSTPATFEILPKALEVVVGPDAV